MESHTRGASRGWVNGRAQAMRCLGSIVQELYNAVRVDKKEINEDYIRMLNESAFPCPFPTPGASHFTPRALTLWMFRRFGMRLLRA